jgi:hypothetical protein
VKGPAGMLTPELSRDARKLIEEDDPELWHRCYPRIYEAPGGYYSPKLPAYQLVAVAEKIRQGYQGDTDRVEMAWACRLVEKRVPIYWVSRDLAEAVRQTMPPVAFDWHSSRLPFEGAVFMLPKGFIQHPDYGEASFVSYARIRAGEQLKNYVRPDAVEIGVNSLIIVAHTEPADCLLHQSLPNVPIDLRKLDALVMGGTSHSSEAPCIPGLSTELTRHDTSFLLGSIHLLVGLLLLMLRRPDLVEQGSIKKTTPARNGAPAREFWQPSIIGKNYRIRRVYVPQGGTHACPRGHWVRGYYRDQPYGPQRSQHKEVWVEPYWRGGDIREDKP